MQLDFWKYQQLVIFNTGRVDVCFGTSNQELMKFKAYRLGQEAQLEYITKKNLLGENR